MRALDDGQAAIHVGTSGWTYGDWQGRFYPEDIKGTSRLDYYMRYFGAVELNASFYRLPSRTAVASWNRRIPPGFHMAVKGSRRITHVRKLLDCEEDARLFLDRMVHLTSMRVILWQLPPSLGKNLGRLRHFLSVLPTSVRHGVEFRHTSWWSPDVADLLTQYRAAWVVPSHPEFPPDVVPTSDFLYVRFHGLGCDPCRWDYSVDELSAWVERLRPHLAGRELYAFFNNDFAANAVKNAGQFRELLRDAAAGRMVGNVLPHRVQASRPPADPSGCRSS